MVTITHGYGEIRLYLDSKLSKITTTKTSNLNPAMMNQDIHIGVRQYSSWYLFVGSFDEIRIYNRVACDDEIKVLYHKIKYDYALTKYALDFWSLIQMGWVDTK